MMAKKHIEQYTNAVVLIENKELLIVVLDTNLKLNDSEPSEVQRLATEARLVKVHIARDPLVLFGVAEERKEVAEESIVDASAKKH
ncbi:hypothetical protein A2U01_0019314 [Trifolium medium]|uniref:Uncharacterized protein n=1 Tax=Trifolium medium TaxID=97028 RepID=A0A392NIL2_9FABA|nr:hypothetical protein [Trifolium medium]